MHDLIKKLDHHSELAQLLESLRWITGAEKLLFFKQTSDYYGLIWESDGDDSGKFNLTYPDLSTFENSGWKTLSLDSKTYKFHLALLKPKISLESEFQKGVALMMSSALEKFQESVIKTDEVPGSSTFALLNEIKYWNLFNHLVQGVVYHNQSGQIVEANPAAERILGLTKDQILGKTSIDPTWKAIHEDGSPFPGEEHPAMIALHSGKEVRNVIMGISSNKKLDITWIVIDAIPEFLEEGGQPKQVLVSFADITQVKEIKLQIKEKKAILKSIMESTEESIWAVDDSMRLLYANSAFMERFRRIHQFDPQIGQPILASFEGEFLETWKANYQRVFQGESISIKEEIPVENKTIYLSTVITPILNVNKVIGAAAFSQDITDTTLKIQTIENQNSRLQEIAWIQSHIVRAPLARLMGLMNLIDSIEEVDLADLKRLSKMLRSSAEELDGVIREVVQKSEYLARN